MTSDDAERSHLPWWLETLALGVSAVGLALLIKTFLLQAFYIPSESMEPGLVVNDRILVQKVSYWGDGEPRRGDVVVFEDPGAWLDRDDVAGPDNIVVKGLSAVGLYPSGGHLVKRVVGVGGDTVKCCDRKGRLRVNGAPIEEPYIAQNVSCAGPMVANCDWKAGPIPEGSLFVMGDNRARSADSTVHMCLEKTECVEGREYVPVDNVVGRVFAVAWPWSNLARVTTPDAFDDVPEPE